MTQISSNWRPPPQPSPGVPREGDKTQNRACAMLLLIYAIIVGLYLCAAADANPSQTDVFRSIHDNVSESDGSAGKVLALMGGGAVLLITLAYFSQRQKKQTTPKSLRSPSKLLREMRKAVVLRNAEVKNLRVVADQTDRGDGEPITSPLVLLLCPSVLAKASRDRQSKADPKIINQVIRKAMKR